MATQRRSAQPNLRVISEEILGDETTTSSDTLPLAIPQSPNEADQARAAAATVSKRMEPPAIPTAPSIATTMTQADPILTASWHLCRALLVVLAGIAAAVAPRVILLLAVAASAGLTVLAMPTPSPMTLSASAVFDVTVVIPLVALYWRRG